MMRGHRGPVACFFFCGGIMERWYFFFLHRGAVAHGLRWHSGSGGTICGGVINAFFCRITRKCFTSSYDY